MASIEWVSKDQPSTGSGTVLRQAQAPAFDELRNRPDGTVRMAGAGWRLSSSKATYRQAAIR